MKEIVKRRLGRLELTKQRRGRAQMCRDGIRSTAERFVQPWGGGLLARQVSKDSDKGGRMPLGTGRHDNRSRRKEAHWLTANVQAPGLSRSRNQSTEIQAKREKQAVHPRFLDANNTRNWFQPLGMRSRQVQSPARRLLGRPRPRKQPIPTRARYEAYTGVYRPERRSVQSP